jgi:DHA1 family inner membrane transport protein
MDSGPTVLQLVTLTLATFAIGSAEFAIPGPLPEITANLGVSIPTTGLLVTGYALGVTVGGPIVTVLTIRLPRKMVSFGAGSRRRSAREIFEMTDGWGSFFGA